MEFARKVGVALLALLAFCPSFIRAQAFSTFYLDDTETQFSLNIADDPSSDIFVYFTSPAYSWVGVGFGESMKNSLMFIMYPSKDGSNVTVSPRYSDGHHEPTYKPSVQLETLPGTTVTDDGMFLLKAACRNCRVWSGSFINTTNRAHPMIFAFGPANRLQSDSPNAPLKRHTKYGKFTMDMVAATGKGEMPPASKAVRGVQLQGSTRDHDRANLAHAIMGCIAIFLLWPLNLIFVGFFKRIGLHVGLSVSLLVFLVISYALGISTSHQYNRSKSYTTPHQILALLTLFPILLISLLPIRPLAALHTLLPRLHHPLTMITLVLLIITGGLGLALSTQPTLIILAYTSIALITTAITTTLHFCIRRRGSAHARATNRHRTHSEDEAELVVKGYGGYAAHSPPPGYETGSWAGSQQNVQSLDDRPGLHGRSASANSNLYGGGTMPGPQYLLNMHPGVPVHKW